MKIICDQHNCKMLSKYSDIDGEHFCNYESILYKKHGFLFKSSYSENIVRDIIKDNSKKLALLNINHENPNIRFIVKYKLNMCFQPLTSLEP